MKITIAQWDLADALNKLQSITPHRTPTPILNNVLLDATEDGLFCTATNGEISLRILIQGLLDEPGRITVHCKRLAALIKTLEDDQVELNSTSNDRLKIKSGKGKYTFGGQSADEFFDMPTGNREDFSIPAGNLRTVLVDTDFAASTEEARYFLNGVALTFGNDKIEFAACDGKQVALSVYHSKGVEELPQLVLPLRSSQEIKKAFTEDEDISVCVEDKYLVFFTGTHQFSTRKVSLEGNSYPNYWQFIEFEKDKVVVANKEQLEKAIKRISLFAKSDNSGISLEVNEEENVLDVSAKTDSDLLDMSYDGYEPVEISSKTSSDLSFKVNSKYLRDVLSHLYSEEVIISLAPDGTRITLQCPDNEDQIYTIALLNQ